MALIILFNANDIEKEKLKNLCEKENVKLKLIGMEDVDQKVGYLAEIEGYEKIESKGEHLDQYDFTFAFFKDFEQKELFDFIDKMRAEGVVIEHKAGITPTNIKWTLRYLLEENDQEHKTMQIVEEINGYLSKARKIKEESGEENPQIAKSVKELNQYFQKAGEDFDINIAKKYRDKIKNLVEKL